MRKIYSSLWVLLLMAVSTVAKAQSYDVAFSGGPIEDYVAGQKSYPATEIAAALGIDVESLQVLLGEESDAVYLKVADGKSNDYTGNHNEFWMNLDGVPQGYGADGTSWFVGTEFEAAGTDEETGESWEDRVNVWVGQMPGVFKKIYTPSALSAVLYIVGEDKEVVFNVSYNVEAAVKADVPDPTTSLSKLNVVKDYTLTLDFVEGKSYENKTYSITLDGIYEALGTTAEAFDEYMADYTYAQGVIAEEVDGETFYSYDETLMAPIEGYDGWFGRYVNYDEATATETQLEMNALRYWGADCTFYTHDFALADGEFSISVGQYPGTMAEGDNDWTYLYIIYGDKAARIKVVADVKKPEVVDPSQMVKVGETTVKVSADIDNNYATKGFTIDMEAIVEALGCTTDDLDDLYAWAAEGELSDNHTEGSGGYYFNDQGYIEAWGSNAAFFIAITSTTLANGNYTIGQMSGHFTDITEDTTVTAQIVFQYGTKYYAVNIEYTVKVPGSKGDDFEYTLVSTEGINMQIIPNGDVYEWETKSSLDLEYIESKIGTTDFTLYTDVYDAEKEEWSWSKNYTCTPAPGFWYGVNEYENAEHQVVVTNAGWGTNSFGITYAGGTITWYQYPGQRSVGDSFVANLYLVNEENGNYIKYVLQVTYVDEVRPEAETVLRRDLEVTVTDEGFDAASGLLMLDIDTDELFEALEITDAVELEGAEFFAAKSSTMFSAIELEELALFGADGYLVPETGEINAMAGFSMENGLQVQFDPMELAFEKGDESKAIVRLAIEYNGKRALYIITFLSEDSPLSIAVTPSQTTAPAGVYSISGARLSAPQKGINIVKMSDGSVQKVLVK